MNTVYAIKDKKTDLYYTKGLSGPGWWGVLEDAKFYRTEDRPKFVIAGVQTSHAIALAMQKAEPHIVPIHLVEVDDKSL